MMFYQVTAKIISSMCTYFTIYIIPCIFYYCFSEKYYNEYRKKKLFTFIFKNKKLDINNHNR